MKGEGPKTYLNSSLPGCDIAQKARLSLLPVPAILDFLVKWLFYPKSLDSVLIWRRHLRFGFGLFNFIWFFLASLFLLSSPCYSHIDNTPG